MKISLHLVLSSSSNSLDCSSKELVKSLNLPESMLLKSQEILQVNLLLMNPWYLPTWNPSYLKEALKKILQSCLNKTPHFLTQRFKQGWRPMVCLWPPKILETRFSIPLSFFLQIFILRPLFSYYLPQSIFTALVFSFSVVQFLVFLTLV